MEKRDTLVVQPTGAGKSAIYQIAGVMMHGVTVVVSPLIALQRDQVDSIRDQPHTSAAELVNSLQKASERRETLERVSAGEVEFLFLAPEQLQREDTRETVRQAHPSLFVIGGGVSAAGEVLRTRVEDTFRAHLTGRGHRPVAEVRLAELGWESGMVGAADLARIDHDTAVRGEDA